MAEVNFKKKVLVSAKHEHLQYDSDHFQMMLIFLNAQENRKQFQTLQ